MFGSLGFFKEVAVPGPVTYPMNILNPGAELNTGSGTQATNWTNSVGAILAIAGNPTKPANAGSFYFGPTNPAAQSTGYQDVAVDPAAHTLIDAGSMYVAWQDYLACVPSDSARVSLAFYNAAMVLISSSTPAFKAAGSGDNGGWVEMNQLAAVPVLTRFIRVIIDQLRSTTAPNDAYVDSISGYLYVPTVSLGTISHVASSVATYANGLSVSASPAAGTLATGDALYASVFARSALTPPSGWTLVKASDVLPGNGATSLQTNYIYRKNSVAPSDGSTSFTWTQAVSNHIGVAYSVYRSTTGVVVDVQAGVSKNGETAVISTVLADAPQMVADSNGEMFLVAFSILMQSGTSSTFSIDPGAGYTLQTSAASSANNRLCTMRIARNFGQANTGPCRYSFSGAVPIAGNNFGCIVLRMKAG